MTSNSIVDLGELHFSEPPTLFAALVRHEARIAELEAVLGEARLQIEYLQEKFQPTSTGNAVLARINAALAGKL